MENLFNIVCFFIFVSFLLNVINPKLFWKYTESWKAKEEPSNIYFVLRRCFAIIGLILISSMIFMTQNPDIVNKLLFPEF